MQVCDRLPTTFEEGETLCWDILLLLLWDCIVLGLQRVFLFISFASCCNINEEGFCVVLHLSQMLSFALGLTHVALVQLQSF